MNSKFFDLERLIHSIKTVIACLIGFALTKLVGLPADQWVIVTILVVMCAQIYVGSVMQKAYWRFLGTLVGCLFAALTLTFVGDTNWAIAGVIALSGFIFSYIATSNEQFTYACTLGAVTTAIIMLGQKPTAIFALERFLEISAGLLIAAVVSQFVLPIHARTHLKRQQADTLTQLRTYYQTMLTTLQAPEFDYHELDEEIVKSLLKQRQLAKESLRERLGTKFDNVHFMQSLYCEREILRAITFMHYALGHIKKADTVFMQSAAAHAFNETILQSLDTLIKAIGSDLTAEEHIHLPSLNALKEELQKELDRPSRDELTYIDGFLFSAEILVKGVEELAELYQVKIFGKP